jgi:hypothetical protein
MVVHLWGTNEALQWTDIIPKQSNELRYLFLRLFLRRHPPPPQCLLAALRCFHLCILLLVNATQKPYASKHPEHSLDIVPQCPRHNNRHDGEHNLPEGKIAVLFDCGEGIKVHSLRDMVSFHINFNVARILTQYAVASDKGKKIIMKRVIRFICSLVLRALI